MALFSTLVDDFSTGTIDPGRWPTATGVTVAGGRAKLTGNAELRSAATYTLTNSSITATLITDGATTTGALQFAVHNDANNYFGVRIFEGWMYFVLCTAGVESDVGSALYDPEFTQQIRLRHDGTNFHVETAKNFNEGLYGFDPITPTWAPSSTMYARIAQTNTAGTVSWVDNINLTPTTQPATPTGIVDQATYGSPGLTQPPVAGGTTIVDQATISGADLDIRSPHIVDGNSIANLVDTFTTGTLASHWATATNAGVVNNQLQLGLAPGASLVESTATWQLQNSALGLRVIYDGTSGANSLSIRVYQNSGNWAGIFINSGSLQALVQAGGSSFYVSDYTTWNATNYQWLQIRHSGGNLIFEATSNPAAGWTTFATTTAPAWVTGGTQTARFGLNDGVALIDNVNRPLGAQPTYPNTLTGTGTVGLPDLGQILPYIPDTVTDAGTVHGADLGQPDDTRPATIIDTGTVGGAAAHSFTVAPTSVATTATVGQPTLSNTPSAAYGDNAYGWYTYGGNPNDAHPISVVDADYVHADGLGGAHGGGAPTTTGYGSGTYGAGVYSGTPASTTVTPATIVDQETFLGAPLTLIGYGSGVYGDGVYSGVVIEQPTTGALPTFTTPTYADPMHLLGIGPWNSTKVWRGAKNYGIGRGRAPARPHLQLPGVQSKSFTLRLNEGCEATASLQFASRDAVIIEEMATDLWWRRKDPRTNHLDMIGRFNTSHNDLTRAADGTLQSNLQFVDYRTILGNRMVLKYKDPDNAESQWDKGTPITEIMRFAVPTDTPVDLSALADDDLLGETTLGFTLPPYNTIADTFATLLAYSSTAWEWWVETPNDVHQPPRLAFARGQRGADRGVTLFDHGHGVTPIDNWQMRATSDTYANTLLFTGTDGGVIRNVPAQIAEYGQRDAQDSDNSVTGEKNATGLPAALIAAADKKLRTLSDRRPTFTVVLRQGFWRGRNHIDVGDRIRLLIKLGGETLDYKYRVTEINVDIDGVGAETVTLTLGNPLASPNPRSQYSPIFKLVRTLKNYEAPDGSPSDQR